MERKERTIVEYIGLVLRGVCMGASDIVPGVSGGTMAFILGIYEELINSIKSVGDPQFLRAVVRLQVKKAIDLINLPFLLAVGAGIGLAILTLAASLEHWLETQPILVWSFFFGLVVASVITVSRRINQWENELIGMLILGTFLAYMIVGLVPVQTPESWWFLLLTGAIAICAMILPGISGSFLLVLMGKYEFVLGAVNDRDIISLGFVAIGAAVGIVLFAQVISWVFARYHDAAIAFLTGLMIGSLRKIWPWKTDVDWLRDAAGEFVLNSDGLRIVTVQESFLPSLGNADDRLLIALGLALVGIVAVLLIDRLGSRAEAV